MKLRGALLLCTALLMPVPAKADPVSAFFVALAGGSATAAATATAIGGLTSLAYTAGTFFATTLGSLILNVGLSLLLTGGGSSPDIERARVNTRLENAPRWQAGGSALLGGQAGVFAEYDDAGNFWYIVAHADAEMTGSPTYFLDGVQVEIAETAVVILDQVDYVFTTPVGLIGEAAIPGGTTDESRVTLTAQADASENGIWITGVGAWSRATDMMAGDDIDYFVVFDAFDGGGTASSYWSVLEPSGTVGTDDMVWTRGLNKRKIGDVLTDDFCLTSEGDQYEGEGARHPYFRLYTVTPDADNVYGELPEDFTDAFTSLPADFRLSGVCFTIVRCAAIDLEDYRKVFRWRGALGLGEPGVTVYASFNRMYDPRNEAHDIDDSDTWTPSDGNPAILWAWWRTTAYGRNRPMSEINWTKVEEQADICDQIVTDRSAQEIPRYRAGVAFRDDTPRSQCEAQILAACDGFVVYDDEGRAWPRVGIYEEPTLTFSDERDIVSAETVTINDGETPLDGVVVYYTSPDHGYTRQPSAPWRNTTYYDGTRQPNYMFIDVLACQDHNQAVRLGKAVGQRVQPPYKNAYATTLKGILAKGVRTIDLAHDAKFTGAFEITSPVEVSSSGQAAAFAVVPMWPDRYDLGEGEEGEPPAVPASLNIDDNLEIAENVSITAVSVSVAGGLAVRLDAEFDAPDRIDRRFRFRYAPTSGPVVYAYFTTDMDQLLAYSGIVGNGVEYIVSWQTTTAGGRATVWSDERETPESVTITATANPTAPSALTAFAADDGTGEATISFTTANDANQYAVEIWRSTTDTFGTATKINTVIASANVAISFADTPLVADTYYYWAIPTNNSGVAGTTSGSDSAVVS